MAKNNSNTTIAKLSLCFSLLIILQFCTQLALCHSIVKFLPGFKGPLPFELETGYVGVGGGESEEDSQLFYYFVKSERNPKEDPLLLWLTGGPYCSAFSALVYEIGPISFEITKYNGSLPTLVLNPYSWTKVASIIFLDSPVGSGFSYARNPLDSQMGDFKQVHQAYQFLTKWLMDHPDFLSSPFYIGGDSYSGITIPALVQQISNGNEEGIKPSVNLQGYILGNPITEPVIERNSAIPFAHGMGLISDELFESLKTTCGGDYQNINPNNADCLEDIQAYQKSISGIESAYVLKPHCDFASPKPQEIYGKRRSLNDHTREFQDPEPSIPIQCHTYRYLLSHYWANDNNVRKALHIRKKTIGEWQRCNHGLLYKLYAYEISSSFSYHVNLSTKGYRSLIYSGDHDMIVPFLGTQAWIRSLNYSIVDDWRSWILQDQVAGYTRCYSNQMTFATIKGGGHTAPEYRPAECFAVFERWILHDPL